MIMHGRLIVAFCGLLALGTQGWSQDEQLAPQAGPKVAEFNRVFAEWKVVLAEMDQLRTEYRAAKPPRRVEIDARFAPLIQQGESTLAKVIDAAQAAFIEAPHGSKRPFADFLIRVAWDSLAREDYETALSIANLLIDQNYHDPHFYGLAGVAAFATGDFDRAGKYLTLAKEGGALPKLKGDQPKQPQLTEFWLDSIPYYQDAWKKELAIRATEEKAGDLPRVLMKTSKGNIELELFENQAPNTVANFISLVEKGFYNGTPFHRVLDNFMAQGGDPQGTGSGGPGYAIRCECYAPDHRLHFRGSLSMAHAGRDTGGSQFFITFVPARFLDGKHTVFGRMIQGWDVLGKLQRRDPSKEDQPDPDTIVEAKVLRKRNHPYQPKTLPDPRVGQ